MSQKNLISLLVLTNLFFFSCTNQNKEELVSFDDLTEASKKYKEGDSVKPLEQKAISVYDSLSPFSKRFIDSMGYDRHTLIQLDTLIFPDRFGAIKTDKWILKTSTDSLVFMYWKFSDSTKTENTFYNWLDCFGSKCRSIHVGDKIAFSKRGHLFLVQDQFMFCIESRKPIDLDRILAFFDNEKWEKQRKFIAIQQAHKKTVWKKRDKAGELLDYQD